MTERSTITQVVNLGLESVPGTQVRANRRLQTIDFTTDPKFKVDAFRPAGFKYDTTTVPNKEWLEVALKGQPTYTEILYMLAGVLGTPAAPTIILDTATDTLGRRWVFESNTSTPDTPQTYTFEQGSSVRAHSSTQGTISDFDLMFTRDKAEMSGKMLCQAINDGITMTALRTVTDGVTTNASATVTSATAAFASIDVGQPISGAGIPASSYIGVRNSATSIGLSSSATANTPVNATASASGVTLTIGQNPSTVPLVPLAASHVTCHLDATSGALGTTKLGRLFSGNFSIGNRFGPVWTVDESIPSWAATVETVPTLGFKMIVEADAAGMALLPLIRSTDTYFLRILARGPVIYSSGVYAGVGGYAGAALTYTYQHDMAVKVLNTQPFSDQQGVYAIGFDLIGVHDASWGKAVHVEVINKMTSM